MSMLSEKLSRYAVLLAALMLLSMIFPVMQLPKLSIDNSIEVWLHRDSQEYRDYETFRNRYGNDEFILVAAVGTNLLADESRDALDVIASELESVEHVDEVISISQVPEYFLEDVENLLISKDRTVGGILVRCEPLEGQSARRALVQQVRDILHAHRTEFGFHLGGPPVMNATLDASSEREARTFFPIAFAVSALILILMTRSITATLIAALAAAVTVIWTLGIMAACGKSLNMVTLVIPTLLWVLSLSNCIHLIHTYRHNRAEGADGRTALRSTLSELLVPCFSASFTTAVGFSTLAVSHMGPIRDLGLFSAAGIMISLLANLTVTPGLLLLLMRTAPRQSRSTPQYRMDLSRLAGPIKRHRMAITLTALLIAVGSAALISRLTVESNVLNFFRKDAEIAKDYRFISSRLSGLSTIEIEIATDEKAPFTAQRGIVDAVVADIKALPGVSGARVESHEGTSQISAFVNVMESRRFNELVTQTETIVAGHRREGIQTLITGTVLLLNSVQEELINTQIRSFALAFLCIFLILAIIFRSAGFMLISLLPNLLPVFVTFGIMAVFSIPLDTGTITIASIAIGIAVDDTIHFLSRIRAGLRQNLPLEDAVRQAYTHAAPPIIYTSLVIALGFFVLCFSAFRPLMLFGLLSGIAMLSALLGDLVFLPALIFLFKPRFGRSHE